VKCEVPAQLLNYSIERRHEIFRQQSSRQQIKDQHRIRSGGGDKLAKYQQVPVLNVNNKEGFIGMRVGNTLFALWLDWLWNPSQYQNLLLSIKRRSIKTDLPSKAPRTVVIMSVLRYLQVGYRNATPVFDRRHVEENWCV
jgi:hypothetical protein